MVVHFTYMSAFKVQYLRDCYSLSTVHSYLNWGSSGDVDILCPVCLPPSLVVPLCLQLLKIVLLLSTTLSPTISFTFCVHAEDGIQHVTFPTYGFKKSILAKLILQH